MSLDRQTVLRIAFFLHDLRGGGVERVSINLANAMSRLGHDVDLVLVNKVGRSAYFDGIDSNISIVELPQKRTLTSAIGFRSYIKNSRPSLVISALTHINVSTLLSAKFLKRRPHIIVMEHNQQIRRQASSGVDELGVAVKIAFKFVPFLYPTADTVGVVSDGIRKDLTRTTKIPENRIRVFYNPISVPESGSLPDARVVEPRLSTSKEPFILGVGSLSYEKNFGLLIDAFAQVRKKRPLKLVIAGEGPNHADLKRQAEETGFGADILFSGFVDNPYALMKDASLLALSSRWEGLPTVLLEAMALGTSVVATDCPSGPSEILQKGAIGRIVPPSDIAALAHGIEKTLDEPQSPEELKRRAADFTPEAAAMSYLNAYYSAKSQQGVLDKVESQALAGR